MAHQKILELKKKDTVNSDYMIVEKGEIRANRKNDKCRIEIKVRDKTGEISVYIWGYEKDLREIDDKLQEGDVVIINGTVGEFNKKSTINVNYPETSIVIAKSVNPEDYLPKAEDIPWLGISNEEIEKEFWRIVNLVENESLKNLLNAVFRDEKFWNNFKRAPASISIHSPFIGGLLHHTVNVAKIAMKIGDCYPSMDKELIIAGALLHDIGKVREYEITAKFSESEEGGLQGHIYFGAEMIKEKCSSLENFPEELKRKLIHMVLSHHGKVQQGWGSTKDPMFPEAMVIAMADLADSQIYPYVASVEKSRKESKEKFVKDKHLGWVYVD